MRNLNSGFDSQSVSCFSEEEFDIVLNRIKALKAIGIYGIEIWKCIDTSKGAEFWSVDTFENYGTYPQDPNWYETAFKKFRDSGEFMYSASFYVPGNYLEFEEE